MHKDKESKDNQILDDNIKNLGSTFKDAANIMGDFAKEALSATGTIINNTLDTGKTLPIIGPALDEAGDRAQEFFEDSGEKLNAAIDKIGADFENLAGNGFFQDAIKGATDQVTDWMN